MSEENFILVSMDDSKSKEISEILGSKTCKKIINYLSENKEASEKDLSEKLNIPLNTIEYNLKKLISTGFVQKRNNFFWSKKGKKIIMYELSNKSVVISHKKSNLDKLKSVVPSILLTAAGTFAVWTYQNIQVPRQIEVADMGAGGMVNEAMYKFVESSASISQQPTPLWAWFLAGALVAVLIFTIINWRKL